MSRRRIWQWRRRLFPATATGRCLRASSSLARWALQARCVASARQSAGLWTALIWASANSLCRTASCSCRLSMRRLCVSKHWSRRLQPCSVKDNIYRLVRYKKRRLVNSLRFLVYKVGNPHIPAAAYNAKKSRYTSLKMYR